MRALIWRPEARRRFKEIVEYVAERNAPAALRLEASILKQLSLLVDFPMIGRPGRVSGTRELVVTPNYIVIYMIEEANIWILRVLHARQKYP